MPRPVTTPSAGRPVAVALASTPSSTNDPSSTQQVDALAGRQLALTADLLQRPLVGRDRPLHGVVDLLPHGRNATWWPATTSYRWWTGSWTKYCPNVRTVKTAPSLRRPRRSHWSPATAANEPAMASAASLQLAGDDGRILLAVAIGDGGDVLVPVGELRVVLGRASGRGRWSNSRNTSRTWQAYSSGDHTSGRGRSPNVRPGQDVLPLGGVGPHELGNVPDVDGPGVEPALRARPLEHPRPVLVVRRDHPAHARHGVHGCKHGVSPMYPCGGSGIIVISKSNGRADVRSGGNHDRRCGRHHRFGGAEDRECGRHSRFLRVWGSLPPPLTRAQSPPCDDPAMHLPHEDGRSTR